MSTLVCSRTMFTPRRHAIGTSAKALWPLAGTVDLATPPGLNRPVLRYKRAVCAQTSCADTAKHSEGVSAVVYKRVCDLTFDDPPVSPMPRSHPIGPLTHCSST